ncbi:xylulokinase [Fusibacter ferrireducens]|uniref:ATPase n=1 Tax=Fusibacter ferrireducens TaxID=2785058 RepID=A0ABR9ZY16_9FIRM|nr:FGGY-family carbohydrate kinase [Fusibacter ferrireducens]MBF4695043.1 ATPase [Fusibacter ferrireducens]
MKRDEANKMLESAYLGIEIGSTRIKAVLIDREFEIIASGSYSWENKLQDGYWTYALEEVWQGIQQAYQEIKTAVLEKYGVVLMKIGGLGISGMMHGYLTFDHDDQLLVPFRTWRNNLQSEASKSLTALFNYPIPERWSIAHHYQALLNGEAHVHQITFLTTIAGYIHWQLTGEKVVGIGEASGMFPIDIDTKAYNLKMLDQYNTLLNDKGIAYTIESILPKTLMAGENAGVLTKAGAALIDPSGDLVAGIALAPPEGDAGTGMVATNCISKRKSVLSAGTSVFGMVVLERDLASVHKEIDQVTTPAGDLVAMVHANNCSSDLNAWVGLFKEVMDLSGHVMDASELFEILFKASLKGESDCGGLLTYGYLSGEHITGFEVGMPLFLRHPDSRFNVPNFMRAQLFSALGAIKIGFDILLEKEQIVIDEVLGHGGIFKTEGVAQRYLAAAIDTSVSVMETAGEGGPWGMAILSAFLDRKEKSETLEVFLAQHVFKNSAKQSIAPDKSEVEGFAVYMKQYKAGLVVEKEAVTQLYASNR